MYNTSIILCTVLYTAHLYLYTALHVLLNTTQKILYVRRRVFLSCIW